MNFRLPSINTITLAGNIASSKFQESNNKKFGTVRIACDDNYKNGQDEWVERTYFIDAKINERLSHSCEYAVGDYITVQGKMIVDSWTTDSGEKRNMVKIQVNNIVSYLPVSLFTKPVGDLPIQPQATAPASAPVNDVNNVPPHLQAQASAAPVNEEDAILQKAPPAPKSLLNDMSDDALSIFSGKTSTDIA